MLENILPIITFYAIGISIFILIHYSLDKKHQKFHQLVEHTIRSRFPIKAERNNVVGETFLTYYFSLWKKNPDFTFNHCHLILLEDALVILGWSKTKLYTTKSRPMVITFQVEKYEKIFPMAMVVAYKRANYYTNANSVYFEIGDLEKSSRFLVDMHLNRLDNDFREELKQSLEKPPTPSSQ